MAFNKKKRRKITVDEQLYFWAVAGGDQLISLRVMADVPGGQHLGCTFDYHEEWLAHESGSMSSNNHFVITPYIVRQVIKYGLKNGWSPLDRGAPLLLGYLDDKIDLRLSENCTKAIRAGTSL